jgi:hypothetical protein
LESQVAHQPIESLPPRVGSKHEAISFLPFGSSKSNWKKSKKSKQDTVCGHVNPSLFEGQNVKLKDFVS